MFGLDGAPTELWIFGRALLQIFHSYGALLFWRFVICGTWEMIGMAFQRRGAWLISGVPAGRFGWPWLDRVVAAEGVIKFLTVRNLVLRSYGRSL